MEKIRAGDDGVCGCIACSYECERYLSISMNYVNIYVQISQSSYSKKVNVVRNIRIEVASCLTRTLSAASRHVS